VKKSTVHHHHQEPTPAAGRRVAELLDAAREQVNDVSPASYARVLRQVETVAEILRETPLDEEDWEEGPRANATDHAARPLELPELDRESGTRLTGSEASAPSITLKEAREVIKALRREDALRHELQLAIGGS